MICLKLDRGEGCEGISALTERLVHVFKRLGMIQFKREVKYTRKERIKRMNMKKNKVEGMICKAFWSTRIGLRDAGQLVCCIRRKGGWCQGINRFYV